MSIDGARHPDILQKKAQARTALQQFQSGDISPRTAMVCATSESEKESILLVDHCRKEPTELTLTTINHELIESRLTEEGANEKPAAKKTTTKKAE